mmetsp:Transcript_17467/g.39383  ORF Transcript_17467/g.39383 Transcript_17467/m.39383 type:complete len:208 (+) Transcript_17467:122-745(+)
MIRAASFPWPSSTARTTWSFVVPGCGPPSQTETPAPRASKPPANGMRTCWRSTQMQSCRQLSRLRLVTACTWTPRCWILLQVATRRCRSMERSTLQSTSKLLLYIPHAGRRSSWRRLNHGAVRSTCLSCGCPSTVTVRPSLQLGPNPPGRSSWQKPPCGDGDRHIPPDLGCGSMPLRPPSWRPDVALSPRTSPACPRESFAAWTSPR